MVLIPIIAPRWHDRTVLVADWKLGKENMIRINHASFPSSFYITGEKARTYPVETKKTKGGQSFNVRVIPINDLEPMLEDL